MNFNRFILLFAIISTAIYFLLQPYTIDQKKLKKIPLLEFSNFETFEFNEQELKMLLVGDHAMRFNDYLTVDEFTVYREFNESVETLSATRGHYKNNLMTLDKSVKYFSERNDLMLESEKALLHLEHKTVDIRVPFVMTQKESKVTGSSLFLNQNSGTIIAKDVKASLDLESK